MNKSRSPVNLKIILLIVSICALTLWAYGPSLNNDFINWDDPVYLLFNPVVQELSFSNLREIFLTFSEGYYHYHPLTIATYALEHHWGGLNPRIYHTTNLVLHLVNILLCFLFMYILTKDNVLSLLCAFFFGMHPMHGESVLWVTARKDVLFASFYLLSLMAYTASSRSGKNAYKFYVCAIALFLLSILSKPTAISLPFVLFLIDYYQGKKWSFEAFKMKIPFFVIAFMYGIIIVYDLFQPFNNPFPLTYTFPFWEKILLAFYALLFYLGKFIWPLDLSGFYPFPLKVNGVLPGVYYYSPFIVLSLMCISFMTHTSNRNIRFGSTFFLVTIFFNLPIFDVGHTIVADRFTYIPYIGLCMVFYECIKIIIFKVMKDNSYEKYILALIVVLLSLFYLKQIKIRGEVFNNSVSFWNDVIEKHPQAAMPYFNRGNFYLRNNQLDLALNDFHQTLLLFPNSFAALNNRGNIYFLKGKYKEALRDYNDALHLNPNHLSSLLNRAAYYQYVQQFDKALIDYERILVLDPHNNLGLEGKRKAIEKLKKTQ